MHTAQAHEHKLHTIVARNLLVHWILVLVVVLRSRNSTCSVFSSSFFSLFSSFEKKEHILNKEGEIKQNIKQIMMWMFDKFNEYCHSNSDINYGVNGTILKYIM